MYADKKRVTPQRKSAFFRAAQYVVESLESRLLLSAVSWTGAGDGTNWSDLNNWSTHNLPASGDDVVINSGASTTVSIGGGLSYVINSLTSNSPIVTYSYLQVNTTAALSANLTINNGGAIADGNWTFSSGAQMFMSGGRLTTVAAVNGNISVVNSNNIIGGGLTLNGTMTIGDAPGNTYGIVQFGDNFWSAGTLGGTASIVFGGLSNNTIQNAARSAGSSDHSFIIGPNVTIKGKSGTINSYDLTDFPDETIDNQGTIEPDVAGGNFTLNITSNHGFIEADTSKTITFQTNVDNFAGGQINAIGGTITESTGLLSNAGLVQATTGGTLTINDLINDQGANVTVNASTLTLSGDYITNGGTITVTNATTTLAATFTQASLGTFNRSGGTVTFTGTLSGDLILNSTTGDWIIQGGKLINGSVYQDDGSTLGFAAGNVFLENFSWNGDLNLTLGSDTITVLGSLSVSGTIRLGNLSATTNSVIFLGTGGMLFDGKSPYNDTGGIIPDSNPPQRESGLNLSSCTLSANSIIFGASSGNAIINSTLARMSAPGTNDPPATYDFTNAAHVHYILGGGIATVSAAIQAGDGSIVNEFSYGTIKLEGSLTADGGGARIYVGGSGILGVSRNILDSSATIQALNGALIILSDLDNSGTVTADSSTLEFTSTIHNGATITATNSTVNLNATFHQSDLGTINRPGSDMDLTGTLLGGLTLNASTGSWNMYSGTVDGGSINESGGAELTFTDQGGIFKDGVVVNGDMDMDAASNINIQHDASLRVYGSFTLNGTAYLGNLQGTSFGSIQFGDYYDPAGTFGGTGTIVFGGGSYVGNSIYNNTQGPNTGALTFGSGITIQGKNGYIAAQVAPASVILKGTVNDNVSGGVIQLGGNTGSVINQGSIQATNGGSINSYILTNSLGKTISATGGSTLTFNSNWTNLGTISSTNSTVNLGGSISRAQLGTFVRSGGTVNLTGTLTGGFNLNASTGSWTLLGGTIQGGIINETGGAVLIPTVNGANLNGVTINGDITTGQAGSELRFDNGLVLNGTLTIGRADGSAGTEVDFGRDSNPAGTVSGTGTFQFGTGGNAGFLIDETSLTGSAGNLTFGPNITIRGSAGTINNYAGAGATIIYQGRVIADPGANGSALQISSFGNTTVQGSLQASGGTIRANGTLNLANTATVSTTWQGAIVLTNASLIGSSTGSAGSNLAGTTTIAGGTTNSPLQLEAMSADRGLNAAAFNNNFLYGTLDIGPGSTINLTDSYDNAAGSGAEALYANALVVENGATLNLNGLHVYARAAQLDGSVTNGTVSLLPDAGNLPLNNPLPGAISPAGNVDQWTFFGRAGEAITVYLNPGGGAVPIPINPNLGFVAAQLIGPDQSVLASDDRSNGGGTITFTNITLPADGTYTIKVSAAASFPTRVGNYVIAAFDVTPQISALNLGENTTGTIRTPFDVQQWTFTAIQGEQVKFHLINESATGLEYSLTGPNGFSGFSNIAGDSSLIDIPANGTYTLSVQGINAALGSYTFVVEPTTQTALPLNGSINGTIVGTGQALLYKINVPSVQALQVVLDDSTNSDVNEMYVRFGTPPTRETYDYRYSSTSAADQTILVPKAAIGTWYVLVYSAKAPSSSSFTLSAHGYPLRLTNSIPAALGNSAAETLNITGAGFEPGATVTLLGSGSTQYAATSTNVVSYTQVISTFASGLSPGVYSIKVTSAGNTDTLTNALTISAGGAARLETDLEVPTALGRHAPSTIYITYSNAGTVAMAAPLLVLASTAPTQIPLFTLDESVASQGLNSFTLANGVSTTIQILASGAVPGVLEPGESIKVPVYYLGLQGPYDFSQTTLPLNLGVVDTSDTGVVNWSSLKSSLQPVDVPNAAWDQIYSNLTAQVGSTWGQFVTALDNNSSYLGSLGENVTDINTLWGFMYAQANDSLGPVDHLQTVFDASLPLPNGGSLSFWRNYHQEISGRFASGMLGNGWSVPYQSSLVFKSLGDIELQTVGEPTDVFQADQRGGYFADDDGESLVQNSDSTYTISASDGESDTYLGNGQLAFHSDAAGNRINYAYDNSGRLISLTASTGQSITLAFNSAGLLSTLTTSLGDVTTYHYDATNHYLTSVTNSQGTTSYGYDHATDELTTIQNPDNSFANLTYDAIGRLASVASEQGSMTLSYEQLGEVTGTDPLGHATHQFYDAAGQLMKTIDALGNPSYFTRNAAGQLLTMGNAAGDFFQYRYDSNGNMTSTSDPLGNTTQMTYTAGNELASYTDANGNITKMSYDAKGQLNTIAYPDGTEEQFTLNNLSETTSVTQRDGTAIGYTYDDNGNVIQESFADGTSDTFTYDAYGELLTATNTNTGATTFTYNSNGSLATVTDSAARTLTYTYNAAGQLIQRVDHDGGTESNTVNYTYDAAGRPLALLDGSNQPIASYTYNADGQLTRQDNSNGTYTTFDYDADGNLIHLINHAPGGGINSRYDGTYNLLNQLVSEATLDGTWNYSYDAAGQLTRAIFTSTNPNIPNQDLAYNYDPVGNRTSTVINGVTTDYSVNSMNEYTSIGGVQQLYDQNGNLIDDGTTTYTYNSLNQLTVLDNPQEHAEFTYTALGQLDSSSANGVFRFYQQDPNGTGTPIAEFDSGANLVKHINTGLGITGETEADGTSYFDDTDLTGSVVGLSNSSGAYVDQTSYLPFGQVLSSSGTFVNDFQFDGGSGVLSDGSNIYTMGARAYSAATGSFTSTDPLQILGGNWNFYTFAYNQPLQLADPSGYKALNPHEGEPWTIAHGIPIVPPMTIINAIGQDKFSIDKFPEDPPSDFSQLQESSGPIGETVQDIIKTVVEEQRLPSEDEILNNLSDHAFDALNKGPLAVFQVGTILKMLCDPDMAVNIGNGILGIQRAQLCGTINGYEAAALVAIGEASPGCGNAPGIFGPKVPAGAGRTANVAIPSSFDPNDKIGPGFGTSGFVSASGTLPYRIDFENAATASAPAQQVVITDQLSSNLDWSTFHITEIGWGDIVIAVPDDSQHYQTTVPMTFNNETFNVLVQVGINLVSGLITAQFLSIDPNTQLPPDVLAGFLPPEDGTGRGMGHISYVIDPVAGLATGTQIRNVANVNFDDQGIIATDQVSETDPAQGVDPTKQALITIDAGAPTSSVSSLPASEASSTFTVNWSGVDDTGGSGIASYTIYISDNGGAFAPWQTNTTATSASYSGVTGHTYAFYSVAADNVGNTESAHASADTQTTVGSQGSGSAVGSFVFDAPAQRLDYTFSGAVPGNINAASLVLTNTTTAQTISPASFTVTGGGDVASFIFPGFAHGLPKGSYQATLNGGSTFNFTVIPGDATQNGTVDSNDFDALAAHFGQTTGMKWSFGDFNYDGIVNALDFNALATNYGYPNSGSSGSSATGSFVFDAPAQRLDYTFSSAVPGNINAASLVLTNTSTSQTISPASFTITGGGDVASFTFPGFVHGLPKGSYQAKLNGGSIFNFGVLPGDATQNGTVGSSDFDALAAHFGQTSGMKWSFGDFNYDGIVNALDFNALATNYGASASAPAADVAPEAMSDSMSTSSIFSNRPIANADADLTNILSA